MNDDEKLMWMFEQVEGKIDGACQARVEHDQDDAAVAVGVWKHGNLCWRLTKLDIVFNYLTKHLT